MQTVDESAPGRTVPRRARMIGIDDGPGISVLVELENIRRKGVERAVLALSALVRELNSVEQSVEVLVGVPGDVSHPWVHDLLSRSGLADVQSAGTQVVPAGERRYYEIKNLLAERSRGEVVVFTDGDVVAQPGWLRGLLAPFDDTTTTAVRGWTYVGPLEASYTRCLAAAWTTFSPLPRSTSGDVVFFDANNVAFRREAFLARPFPAQPDQYRGACAALARRLAEDGVPVVRRDDAVALHPPLAFPFDLITWSLLSGRDRALRWNDLSASEYWSNARSWVRTGFDSSLRAVWVRRRACELRPPEIGGAVVLAAAMWMLRVIGLAVCRKRPSAFRRWL